MNIYQCPNCGANGNYKSHICQYCDSVMTGETSEEETHKPVSNHPISDKQGVTINNINHSAPPLGSIIALAAYLLIG